MSFQQLIVIIKTLFELNETILNDKIEIAAEFEREEKGSKSFDFDEMRAKNKLIVMLHEWIFLEFFYVVFVSDVMETFNIKTDSA